MAVNQDSIGSQSALSTIIRYALIGFGVFLLIPPWGLITLAVFSIRVVQEYERGVIFRLGRLVGAKGPGLFIMLPFVDRMVKVDLRTISVNVPAQEAITRDNVTVKVDAVIYYKVVSPEDAITKIEDFEYATSHIAQTTLRSVLGNADLDELLTEREQINQRLQQIIDGHTEPWGVKVTAVEVKDLELPTGMQRAMARQAEAERERRAKVIHAEGEYEASERLAAAGAAMATTPATLQLRYLQTLTEIAAEKNSTIIFPMPIDVLTAFQKILGANGSAVPPAN